MADMIKFFKGLEASLPAAGVDGGLYITTDEGAIYLGTGTGMKRLGDFVQVANIAALPEKAHETCLYYCVEENVLAKWNGTEWKQINKQPTADDLKDKLGLGALAYLDEVAEEQLESALKEKINNADAKAHTHDNKDVIDGISAAKVEAWDKAEQNAKDYADTELAKKVDKVEGKSLVDDAEITKLAGVSEGANKVEASTVNGSIKIDGVDTVVYTHPEKHTIAEVEGLQDALDGKQAVGDYATKTEAQGYADAKDTAIAEAKKAGTDAQAAIDAYVESNNKAVSDLDAAYKAADKAITDSIGTVAEGKTVVQMIEDAQEAATYDDTEVRGLITAEKERAEGIEGGLRTDVDAIKADYLKAADKTELEGKITTNANAIERLTNGISPDEIDGVNDLIDYVNEHGADVIAMKANIKANADAIAAQATADAATYETKEDATAKLAEAKKYTDDGIAAVKSELQGEIDADVKVVNDALEAYKTANNAEVAKKANAEDVYTKTEVDAMFTWGSF